MLDHEAYPGRYRCRDGRTGYVTDLQGNFCVGYRYNDNGIAKGMWWHLNGATEYAEEGVPAILPTDLVRRYRDPLPIVIRRWWKAWWGQ